MDSNFWLERWHQMQIGFHQDATEPLLQKHWPTLGLAAGSTVFVPLCGKSLDMVWLAAQGHRVIGCELSQIAINDFFATLDLTPETRMESGFTVKSVGPYELWCGDFFALPPDATKAVRAIYDRAALVALPPDMRQRYARKLVELGSSVDNALLITLEYDQAIVNGPPHSVPPAEVQSHFTPDWRVMEMDREQTDSPTPRFKEHGIEIVDQAAYKLTPASQNKAISE
jgi:thiopurine S-methyltransferase